MILTYFLIRLTGDVEIDITVVFDHCCKLMKYSDYFMLVGYILLLLIAFK